jgi:hypothetical protein
VFAKMLFMLLIVIPVSVLGGSSYSKSELRELLKVKIRSVEYLAFNPVMTDAVEQQNAESLSMETIKQRDAEWRSTDELTPLKRSLEQSKAGKFLKRHVSYNPAFNEAFLTDNQGANVAAYPATSDYWQGDEEKWTESFNGGEGQLFLGPVERDESTDTDAVQISYPVIDEQGQTIGVLVVGVNLSYIKDRQTLISR